MTVLITLIAALFAIISLAPLLALGAGDENLVQLSE